MGKIDREKDHFNRVYDGQSDEKTPPSLRSKFMSVATRSTKYYYDLLTLYCSNKNVLEYGCGMRGSAAFYTGDRGADSVVGIDISSVAIEKVKERVVEEGRTNMDFCVANAEKMEFPDNRFDLICGSGILHHLDITKAYAEIARILSSDGRAIFREPLGHNPIINIVRKLTPNMRTKDEHPLLEKDLKVANNYFYDVETKYFHLLSLLAIPFVGFPFFNTLLEVLDSAEEKLFRIFPSLQKYAWIMVMKLGRPKM